MKIALIYSYDGSKFDGSQTQPNGLAVENGLNLALNRVGIFEDVISSSRTDKGVHGLSQVSTTHCGEHFDNMERLKNLINKHAAPHIYIKQILRVNENFQVRFDAKARLYRYILNHAKVNPFSSQYCYFCKKPDIKALNLALSAFVGRHDFSDFMKSGSGTKSPIREIFMARAYEYGNLSVINFKANGFLRSQVRLMVANALKAIDDGDNFFTYNFAQNNMNYGGLGRSNFKLRSITRLPSPAQALYLTRIFY